MKVDGGVPGQLEKVADAVRRVEAQGYDGAWSAEVNHDPFLPLAIAAEHTSRLSLGTGIAVAFARNPMTLANVGWDLQAYSRGRLMLGLGSQIQAHIEKRFSMPWSHPAPRMRELILAVRAIWACWQDGGPLRFEGEFYTHKLMTPMFVHEPHEFGAPKVFLAAVGSAMTEVVGEVADGMLVHAFTTERYLREVTLAALGRGLSRAGRERNAVELSCPVFVVTGADERSLEAAAAGTRRQIAFYASTPAYRPVLELHGWGDLQAELNLLSKQGKWAEMGELIDDEMLETFAVIGPPDKVPAGILSRYAGAVDRVTFYMPYAASDSAVAEMIDGFHQAG